MAWLYDPLIVDIGLKVFGKERCQVDYDYDTEKMTVTIDGVEREVTPDEAKALTHEMAQLHLMRS